MALDVFETTCGCNARAIAQQHEFVRQTISDQLGFSDSFILAAFAKLHGHRPRASSPLYSLTHQAYSSKRGKAFGKITVNCHALR